MKRFNLKILCSLALVIIFMGCATHGIPKRPDKLGLNPVEFSPQEPQTWTLGNGLKVLFLEDNELPLVHARLYLPGGSWFDPPGLSGLAAATGSQMREGSTAGISPQELDQKLDALGASIEASYSDEYGSVGLSSLAEDFETTLAIMARLVREPQFDLNRLELWKRLALHGIAQRRDDPGTMAGLIFTTAIYGPDSAFSVKPSPESVARITRADLKRFHRRFVRPDGAYLAVSGSITRDDLDGLLEEHFGTWRSPEAALPPWPAVSPGYVPGIYLLQREFDQATITIGHIGPPRLTDDMYAISVFNRIFGLGGFDNILFNEIRSKQGLAYSVYGGLFPERIKGTLTIGLSTRNDQAPQAIRTTLELMQLVTSEPADEVAVRAAKDSVIQSFVFRFGSSSDIVQRRTLLKLLDYPEGFDASYLDNIAAVSPTEVSQAAKTWVLPKESLIVVVGNLGADDLRAKLGSEIPIFEVGFSDRPELPDEALAR